MIGTKRLFLIASDALKSQLGVGIATLLIKLDCFLIYRAASSTLCANAAVECENGPTTNTPIETANAEKKKRHLLIAPSSAP